MEIKIINKSKNELPVYQTEAAAGMDLRANLENDIELLPGKRALIPTGLYMECPLGFEAQIRPRSGLAFKYGITVLNSPGTIDADYRGEIKILLINHGEKNFIIRNADRIAQMTIVKHERINWREVNYLNDTARGSGGYGSTGK